MEVFSAFIVDKPDLYVCVALDYCSGGDLASYIKKMKARQVPSSPEVASPLLLPLLYPLPSGRFPWFILHLVPLDFHLPFLLPPINASSHLSLFQIQLDIVHQLLRALQFLHVDRRIVHRDIKLGNILVYPGPIVKMSDFGLAKELTMSSRAYSVVGTPLFIAPEVVKFLPYGRPADIFSMGISSSFFSLASPLLQLDAGDSSHPLPFNPILFPLYFLLCSICILLSRYCVSLCVDAR